MLPNVGFLALFFTAAVAVHALADNQINKRATSSTASSSTPTLTPCISGCLQNATSSSTCSTYTNLQCVCTNTQFQQASEQCLLSKCTSAEQAAALALQKSECASLSSSASSSSTATSISSKSSSTSSSSSSSSPSSGAAIGNVRFGHGELVGIAVALVGVIVGAELVF